METVKKGIKKGDLVTLDLGEYSNSSNTYRVEAKIRGKSILAHPLAPECYIIKKDSELNNVVAVLQNPTEKCLFFASKKSGYLNFATVAELEALNLYFVVNKELTHRQKATLSQICGHIAMIIVKDDLTKASEIVKENVGLLDEFNVYWYNKFKELFEDVSKVKVKNQRISMFNITGFVLAQLESN